VENEAANASKYGQNEMVNGMKYVEWNKVNDLDRGLVRMAVGREGVNNFAGAL